MSGVHPLPLTVTTGAQEVIHVDAHTLVEGIIVFVQVLQVGDALTRRSLPGGQTSQHEEGVEPQKADDDEAADD